MASEETLTPASYIQHHLKNLAITVDEGSAFWTIHVDTFATSLVVGLGMVFAFWLATRKATAGVPGKWQAFVEIVLEFVDKQAKDAYHGPSRLVTPIAITLFCWILVLNSIKMIPADFLAGPFAWLSVQVATLLGAAHPEHYNYWKPVPTADLNATFGLSLSVFFLMIFFALRAKGLGGFVHELFTAPFGKWMFPANLLLNAVELLSKPVSLAMRLFGNMFAGEVLFLLIWALGGVGLVGVAASGLLGLGWMLFHLLVIPLQAFIFMMLSIVYLSLMEEGH
jgi:F-type H+-transporting ATPase subunit a